MPSPTKTSPQAKTRVRRRRPSTSKAADRVIHLDSPSLEVLGALDVHDAIASMEARLTSMEMDIAREASAREDEAARTASELAVMRARVQDALDAFAGTADELRAMAAEVDKRNIGAIGSTELDARVEGAMAGVGQVLTQMAESIGTRVDELADEIVSLADGLTAAVDEISTVSDRLRRLEP